MRHPIQGQTVTDFTLMSHFLGQCTPLQRANDKKKETKREKEQLEALTKKSFVILWVFHEALDHRSIRRLSIIIPIYNIIVI